MSLLETIKITPPGLIALRYPDGREVTYGELGVAAERARECRLPDGPVGLCLADPLAVIAWSAGLLSQASRSSSPIPISPRPSSARWPPTNARRP